MTTLGFAEIPLLKSVSAMRALQTPSRRCSTKCCCGQNAARTTTIDGGLPGARWAAGVLDNRTFGFSVVVAGHGCRGRVRGERGITEQLTKPFSFPVQKKKQETILLFDAGAIWSLC